MNEQWSNPCLNTHTHTHKDLNDSAYRATLGLPVSHLGWLLAAAGQTRLTVRPPELSDHLEPIQLLLSTTDWSGLAQTGTNWIVLKTATLADHWTPGRTRADALLVCPPVCPSVHVSLQGFLRVWRLTIFFQKPSKKRTCFLFLKKTANQIQWQIKTKMQPSHSSCMLTFAK